MSETRGRELTFRTDPVTEQQIIAAVLVDPELRKELVARYPADVMLTPEHVVVWATLKESVRRGIAADPATLQRLSGGVVDSAYLADLMRARPDAPARKTVDYWVEQWRWDKRRHTALTGPVSALLEAFEKNEPIDRVRGLCHAVGVSCDNVDHEVLLDSKELVRAQIEDVRARMEGRAVYPFGMPGLDYFDPETMKERRMIPGAKPGLVTVITGIPGAGKSTVVTRIVLGLMRQKRRVLYGAWEMTGGTTLELLACFSLGWSRTALMQGQLSEEHLAVLRDRMVVLLRYVQFFPNPFRKQSGKKASNERNLDIVQQAIADSHCDVFVGDLWKRCLVKADPEDEEEALYRQQAICEEQQVHAILVQQQRLKDIEARPDKRPTREGVKGSGAWVEVADNMIGVHRPALWKPVTDDVLELDVLKQRYGKWPAAIEFVWDGDKGSIEGGRHVEYDVASSGKSGNPIDDIAREPKSRKGK